MALSSGDRLRDALRNPPIGSGPRKPGQPVDLEVLLRSRQDALRGRSLTRWEIARERFRRTPMPDWEGFAMGSILISCAAIMAALAVLLWVAILAG